MNTAEKFDHEGQWKWWMEALAGNVAPGAREAAESGFYRTRHGDAVAVWRDESGTLFCRSSGKFQPRTAEQIDQTITGDGCRVITHEVYADFVETGRWPDDIDPPTERGIGDNSVSFEPHEAIVAEINDLKDRFAAWLKTIGGKIASEEHNAKADKYARAVAALKTRAENAHKIEKEPHLLAGRAVDASWKPAIALADDVKRTMLAPTVEYRRARAAEETKKRDAEIGRQRAEQAKSREQGDRPAPVSMPPPKATGLRTVKRVVITDLPALAAQLAVMSTPDFLEVCEKIARRMLTAGAEVKGAELIEERIPS